MDLETFPLEQGNVSASDGWHGLDAYVQNLTHSEVREDQLGQIVHAEVPQRILEDADEVQIC